MADAATAIRKLQSGQPLTDDEKKILGISVSTTETTAAPIVPTTEAPVRKKVISTFTDPDTGDIIDVYDDNTESVRRKGTKAADKATDAAAILADKKARGQSAFDFLKLQMTGLGIGDLVSPLEDLIKEGMSSDEMTLRLMNDPKYNKAYKARFAANDARIAAGLSALSPADYIRLEDQYQNIMRNYGLPASYYTKDATGKQAGFEKFIAGDVSSTELEERIMTAQNRVINANPEVANALKQFYPDISNGDILAYTLDPTQGLEAIKRKVTAAEIGGAAMAQGLATGVSRAEELARYGVTKDAAQKGFETVAQVAPRGGQLAAIYGQDPYTQATAETEIFNLAGSAEAGKQRKKLTELEQASFSKQSGLAQGALARDRAGAY
jgi:hypothetical protein